MIPRKRLPLFALFLLVSLDGPAEASAQEPADLPCDPCELAKAWPNLPPDARAELAPHLLSLLVARSRAEGDRRAEAALLALQGLATLGTDQLAEGYRLLAESLDRLVELGDTFGVGTVALILGLARAAHGDLAESEDSLGRAIDSFAATREPLVLDTEGADGIFLALLDVPPQALGLSWRSSARPSSAARAGEALARTVRAEILAGHGRLGAAEAEYLRARGLARALAGGLDHPAQIGLGKVLAAQGRSDDARRALAEALVGLDAVPVYDTPRRTLEVRRDLQSTLTELDRASGHFDEALERNTKALEATRRSADAVEEALVLFERAGILHAAGDREATRAVLRDLEALARGAGDDETRLRLLLMLVVTALQTEQFETAALHALEAAGKARELRLPDHECSARLVLALTWILLGVPDRSLREARRALELAQEIANDDLVRFARTLEAIARSSEAVGTVRPRDLMAALRHWRGLESGSPKDGPLGVMAALAEAASARDRGAAVNLEALLAGVEEALADTRARPPTGAEQEEASLQDMHIALLALSSRREEAREEAVTALASARRGGDVERVIDLLGMLSLLDQEAGKTEAAIETLREALVLVESRVPEGRLDDQYSAHFAHRKSLYDRMVTLLSATRRTGEAFAYAERARARALLHLLGNQRLNPNHGAEPALLAQAEAIRARIIALEGEVRVAADESSAAAARRRADAARRDLEDLLLRIKLSSPQYATLTRVEPVALAAVQAMLPPTTTLVSFYVTDSRVYAWVVTDRRSTFLTLEVRRERLGELVERFRQEIATREPSPVTGRDRGISVLGSEAAAVDAGAGEQLAQVLLTPLMPELQTRHLLVIPHDSLHYLPFAALRNPATGRYLVEEFTLSYAPSASVLQLLERRAGSFEGRVLVLGDPAVPAVEGLPPLAGALREAAAVARLFGTPARLGAGATETIFRDQARGVDFLHVAAHNVSVPGDPRMSYLAFAPDGRHDGKLEMREIFEELDLETVDLVVLSACETALGERTGGDEIVGLTRALLYAGAASVMASLWSVDDDASAALMTAFYVRLLDGEPAAAALAAAQRELLAAEGSAAPFYWAAFTLVGEPWAGRLP